MHRRPQEQAPRCRRPPSIPSCSSSLRVPPGCRQPWTPPGDAVLEDAGLEDAGHRTPALVAGSGRRLESLTQRSDGLAPVAAATAAAGSFDAVAVFALVGFASVGPELAAQESAPLVRVMASRQGAALVSRGLVSLGLEESGSAAPLNLVMSDHREATEECHGAGWPQPVASLQTLQIVENDASADSVPLAQSARCSDAGPRSPRHGRPKYLRREELDPTRIVVGRFGNEADMPMYVG